MYNKLILVVDLNFSADELVKRINSLEFFNRQKLKEEFMIQYANRVKAHQYDDDSPEVKCKMILF